MAGCSRDEAGFVPVAEAAADGPAGQEAPEQDLPGDPPCLLRRVCPACGSVADEDPPTTCPQCGTTLPAP